MSTRALRKLQREQEIQRELAAAQTIKEDETEESEEEEQTLIPRPKNAFDMLNEAEEDEDEEDDEDIPEESTLQHSSIQTEPVQPSKPKKKKKKSKKKPKSKPKLDTESRKEESEDEIDRALKEIAAKGGLHEEAHDQNDDSWEAGATHLLAIENKNLNPTNEMRSLFGNVAMENHDAPASTRQQRTRERNLQGGVDLATALTGRYSIASRGKELGSLATRRNCFTQGKAEWPLATSGGLSMERLPDNGFEKQYKLIHNQLYQEVQMHFRAAVNSMQGDQMIGLLMANPYHVATLLQVSEIAKHQGDHSVSGDLLERTLFTIGRSVHSSFPSALRDGTARLDFNEPANRELYLAIWRYIRNLEMRGTWRTSYEWAKILLQLNTLSDPYGVTLMIDQLAIRGRQHNQLLELASAKGYGVAWQHLPNIQISLTLAYLKAHKPKDARRQLAIAMHHYPYILQTLASALEISPMPKSLWGKVPSTAAEKLYTELYVTRAKDLWNTPETTALIVEVAETLSYYQDAIASSTPAPSLEISLEEARHIMLLEIPQLIALLPRKFTTMPTSSSDVLPPPSSAATEFTARAPTANATAGPNPLQAIFSAAGQAAGAPLQGASGVLQRILNWFHAPAGPSAASADGSGESEDQAAFRALREEIRASNGGQEVSDEIFEQVIRMRLGEGDEEVTAAGLGMAGDWDYYGEHAEGSNRGDDDDDATSAGMPELENMENSTQQTLNSSNPRAARVEEADSDDEPIPGRSSQPSQGILRHIDSDDEDGDSRSMPRALPSQPSHTVYAPVESQHRNSASRPAEAPSSETNSAATPSSSNPDPDNTVLKSNDPQRIQRYLLTTGLSSLQSHPDKLPHYLQRLKLLRRQQQDWIVNMVSQRGSDGKDLAERIRREL